MAPQPVGLERVGGAGLVFCGVLVTTWRQVQSSAAAVGETAQLVVDEEGGDGQTSSRAKEMVPLISVRRDSSSCGSISSGEESDE